MLQSSPDFDPHIVQAFIPSNLELDILRYLESRHKLNNSAYIDTEIFPNCITTAESRCLQDVENAVQSLVKAKLVYASDFVMMKVPVEGDKGVPSFAVPERQVPRYRISDNGVQLLRKIAETLERQLHVKPVNNVWSDHFPKKVVRKVESAGQTSQKAKAVGRLVWILEEAARRVGEEKLRYFTDGLLPLQFEIDLALKELEIKSAPFKLKREFISETDERSKDWAEITTFFLSDPTGRSGHGVLLCGKRWQDKATRTVRDTDSGDLELTELRQKTLITFRRWIDWLNAEHSTPEPVDEEVETEKSLTKLPKQTAVKTGRPVKKKLTKQQLQAIHRRTEKEDLSVIFESYPDFKYHTAYRQYKQWLKENH